MVLEIINIGNELISGKIRDLNGWYASGCLLSQGLEVCEITTVGDNCETVSSALREAVERSDVIIVTGGLGPTDDDLTAEIAAKTFDRELFLDQSVLGRIREDVEKSGRSHSPSLEKLAWIPKGAKILDPQGRICGFSLSEERSMLYFLPGVPEQMRESLERFVVPDILRRYRPDTVPRQRILKVYGLLESDISDVFKDLADESKGIMFGFYPVFPENHIAIIVHGKEEAAIESVLEGVEAKIRDILGAHVFASGEKTMEAIVGELLKEQKLTLSVAESCTGGLIGHRLTSVAGSSLYFERGAIVYSNKAKVEMLGVDQRTLDLYGAVSDQTVREMAAGVRRVAKTDIGIAVTGIAGPLGGTEDKPVGTVFIGLSVEGNLFSGKYHFSGDRDRVKLQTSEMALDWVRRYVNGYPFIPGI